MTETSETPEQTVDVDPVPSVAPPPNETVEPPVTEKPRKGSVVLPVVGGVVAAVIGFAVAQYYPTLLPNGEVEAMKTALAAQTTETKTLQDQVKALTAAAKEAPDTGLTDRIAALEKSLAELSAPEELATLAARVDALDQKLTALPTASASGPDMQPAIARLQAEIDALKTTGLPATVLDEAKAALDAKVSELDGRLAGIKADAEAVAKATVNRAALRQIQAALDSGGPYTSAIADLSDATLPPVLTDHANSGLPSLASLRDGFPLAARAAIDAALRADMGESWTERLSAFFRGQTGARSLTPREGTDPDAILSRAEGKLSSGDLDGCLTEISALSPEGQAAMADWVAKAQLRLDATAAIRDLLSNSGL